MPAGKSPPGHKQYMATSGLPERQGSTSLLHLANMFQAYRVLGVGRNVYALLRSFAQTGAATFAVEPGDTLDCLTGHYDLALCTGFAGELTLEQTAEVIANVARVAERVLLISEHA